MIILLGILVIFWEIVLLEGVLHVDFKRDCHLPAIVAQSLSFGF